MHGDLLTNWKNGNKRRVDIYKKGRLKVGKVWNEDGEELKYFPKEVPLKFPGGKQALYSYLKDNINMPATQKRGTTVKVFFRFLINEKENLSEIEIIEGAPHSYNA